MSYGDKFFGTYKTPVGFEMARRDDSEKQVSAR
jgi:hypothetical protein